MRPHGPPTPSGASFPAQRPTMRPPPKDHPFAVCAGVVVCATIPRIGAGRVLISPLHGEAPGLFLARYYLMYKVGVSALQRGRREDGHGHWRREDGHGHWRRAPWAAKAFREAVEARSSPRGRGLRPGRSSYPYTPECVEEAFCEVRENNRGPEMVSPGPRSTGPDASLTT